MSKVSKEKMSRPRTCPKCKVVIPMDAGFHFDKELNLVCDNCKETIIPSKDTTQNSNVTVSNSTNMGWQEKNLGPLLNHRHHPLM